MTNFWVCLDELRLHSGDFTPYFGQLGFFYFSTPVLAPASPKLIKIEFFHDFKFFPLFIHIWAPKQQQKAQFFMISKGDQFLGLLR